MLLAELGGAYSGDEAPYLSHLGNKLADAAGLGRQCTFTLVNSDVVNAFAVQGCYIYVTRGLMGIVNSEGELASVVAHELGHIAGEHNERQQRRSLFRSLGVAAIATVTGSERLTRLAGSAATFFTLRYSRKHEYEADELGLSYLRDAGYDPYAAADMLGALHRHESFLAATRGSGDANIVPEWALTHPYAEHRIARAMDAARKSGVQPDQLPEFEAEYLRQVDGLLYGDDPAQGFVIGRSFAHRQCGSHLSLLRALPWPTAPERSCSTVPTGSEGSSAAARSHLKACMPTLSACSHRYLARPQWRTQVRRTSSSTGSPLTWCSYRLRPSKGR
jgi:predicted Zn-dependent protease